MGEIGEQADVSTSGGVPEKGCEAWELNIALTRQHHEDSRRGSGGWVGPENLPARKLR